MGGSLAQAAEHTRNGRLDLAEVMCRDVLTANRRDPAALHLLGSLAQLRGRDDLATELISCAILVDPTAAIYHADLGGLHYRAGHLVDAASSLTEAVRLAPDDVDLRSRLGATLLATGALDAARECFECCLATAPDHAGAHAGLGLLLLQTGELDSGWAEYEWRWRSGEMEASRPLAAPAWTGEPLAGRRLLLWAEQGLGDTLQFARYARLLAQRGASVVLEVQPELERLMHESLPEADVVPRGEALPDVHVQAPLMSVPYLTQTRLATIPADRPYLSADPERAVRWAERLGPRGGRRRIGLAWAGNPTQKNDRRRSLDPAQLAPLAGMPGVAWVSLQKDAVKVPPFEIVDRTDDLTDFAETAALLMNLDLVITVDTAVAHLAGALGRPVWLVLAYAADWRWLLERTDSPWYPTARLFRQPRAGDWGAVIAKVAAALSA